MREPLEQGGVEVAVVAQPHEQGPQCAVYQFNVRLRVVRHELQGEGEREGEGEGEKVRGGEGEREGEGEKERGGEGGRGC